MDRLLWCKEKIQTLLKENLTLAQNLMNMYADKRRTRKI